MLNIQYNLYSIETQRLLVDIDNTERAINVISALTRHTLDTGSQQGVVFKQFENKAYTTVP